MLISRAVAAAALCLSTGALTAAAPSLSASGDSAYAIDSSGNLLAWGSDAEGQLGLGRVMQSAVPVPVALQGPFVRVAAGSFWAGLALGADGTLWSWGRSLSRRFGDGSPVGQPTPVAIGSGFTEIALGSAHGLALKADGSIWGWGDSRGLGDAGALSIHRPTPLPFGNGFTAIAAGTYFSLALKADGSLWSWGSNQGLGQLGTGQMEGFESQPVRIGTRFSAISACLFYSLALKTDGTLWAWGGNYSGGLGDGTQSHRAAPIQVGSGFKSIVAGQAGSLALKIDGSLWSWGSIGPGLTPTQIGTGFNAIASGGSHALAVKSDGSLWALGSNVHGEVGDGTTEYRPRLVLVGSEFQAVAAAGDFSLAIKADGRLWAWGSNSYGALGAFADPISRPVPALVGTGFRSITSSNHESVLAIKSDDTLWAWGTYSGAPLQGGRRVPVQVGSGFTSVATYIGSFALGVKRDGSLWAWGQQLGRQFGDVFQPTQIGTGFAAVAVAGETNFALKKDGTLHAWGADANGLLGLGGPATERCNGQPCLTSPTPIGTGFSAVSAKARHALALKTDGSLWAWGANESGQLGDGSISGRAAPVQVGSGYSAIAAGGRHSLALRLDKSMWAWGSIRATGTARSPNVQCQLPECYVTRPEQVDAGFADISAGSDLSLALKTDGTVWAAGHNTFGQLGLGTLSFSLAWTPVVDASASGLLDLTPENPIDASHLVLPFFLKTEPGSAALLATLTDLRAAGRSGEVYFTALLPTNSPLLACGSACPAGPAAGRRHARSGPARGPLNRVALVERLDAGSSASMVAGVLTRGGFKQTGGAGYVQADAAYNGDLGRSGTLDVYRADDDPLVGSIALICMGVTVPELSAKGQVLMRPIASGGAVQGAAQCPPVQTAATVARFRSESRGPITSRTITGIVTPLAEDRGKTLQVFSWAVAPDGRQYMQTGPNQWETMTEPMRPAATITVPAVGDYRLEVTLDLDLSGLTGTLVFIGLGANWDEVRNLNKAGHHLTVQ